MAMPSSVSPPIASGSVLLRERPRMRSVGLAQELAVAMHVKPKAVRAEQFLGRRKTGSAEIVARAAPSRNTPHLDTRYSLRQDRRAAPHRTARRRSSRPARSAPRQDRLSKIDEAACTPTLVAISTRGALVFGSRASRTASKRGQSSRGLRANPEKARSAAAVSDWRA